jgi:hypothetical protein
MTIPIGVYRGSPVSISRVEAHEVFLSMPAGTSVSYVLAFAADTPATWAQFEQAILMSSTNGPPGTTFAAAWAPLLGNRKLILGLPACALGTTWEDEATGINDVHWSALARNLVSGGLGDCVLRVAREFNGGWYRWTGNPGNAAQFVTGYKRIVSVMRDAGFTGSFMWNPYLLQGSMGPREGAENLYPGNSAVDIIGLDLYDGGYPACPPSGIMRTAAEHQAAWEKMQPPTAWDGLTGWHNFAAARDRPLAYPEWGLRLWNDGRVYTGGGDNPLFISSMAAWISSTEPLMHALWEDTGMGVADPDAGRRIPVPASRSVFLRYFGFR